MPELPEVERVRRLVERNGGGRRIEGAWCAADPLVFRGSHPQEVRNRLEGAEILGVFRWGKILWLELDRVPVPVLHLGMTGDVRVRGVPPLALETVTRRPEGWPPSYTKLLLRLDDGGELAFVNPRRLGRVLFVERPREEPPVSRLGPDLLIAPPERTRFRILLASRRGAVKGVLLDQSALAGCGNWIADEALFQAGVAPHRRSNSLTEVEAERVRCALIHVIDVAVRVDAEKARFPTHWLFHRRWDRRCPGETAEGDRIAFATVAGRTTAWVPARQR